MNPINEPLKEFKFPSLKPLNHDPIKVATQLMLWVKKETSISMCDFCWQHGYTQDVIRKLAKNYEDFYNDLQLVKMKMAERRERLLNAELLERGTFHRHQALFDPFLNKFEESKKDKEASRKAGIVKNEHANLVTLAQLAAEGKFKSQ